ncbi:MAG: pseudaminic acid synthase [Candidatus Omnitrophica bacterium]|nr:pseudaminic acid synthase [Candidatus Omnitrophota bacterium]
MLNFKDLKKTFIIAEISANHGQDFDRAAALIKKARECGADAVKFQTYTADTLTIDCSDKYFMVDHPQWGGQSLYELYKKACTPWSWFPALKKIARKNRIILFSTVFDRSSVDAMEDLDMPLYKIASFELVDLPLIKYVAKTGKPLIMSTGMATRREIEEAVDTARHAGARNVALLKCVSSYPADPSEMNLRTIPHMRKLFNVPVGISDHTLGSCVSVAAVTLGAAVVEKHFTLARRLRTPDGFFSVEPDELKMLVNDVRTAEKAVGRVHYGVTPSEARSRIFRRSLFVVRDIRKGQLFTDDNIRSIRPSYGLMPKYLPQVLGRKAASDLRAGQPLRRSDIERRA